MAAPRSARSAATYRLLFFVALLALGVALFWRWASPGAPAGGGTTQANLPAGPNTPQPRTRIGLVAGHNRVKTLPGGDTVRDADAPLNKGAFCPDSDLIEADVTLDIARRVATELRRADRLDVEILGEFDPRLAGYFGVALISLHVDACVRGFSGYKVARITNSAVPAIEDRLVNCLRQRYSAVTGLAEHRNTITPDMTEYHAFREIAQTTPGAIIELGFIRDDAALLQAADLPAKGVVEGVRCFLAAR